MKTGCPLWITADMGEEKMIQLSQAKMYWLKKIDNMKNCPEQSAKNYRRVEISI
jgi:hypothetical protein